MLFGRDAITPIEKLRNIRVRYITDENDTEKEWQKAKLIATQFLETNQSKQKDYYDATTKEPKFKVNDSVYYKNHRRENKIADRWEGPFKVTNLLSGVTIEIVDEVGTKMKVHANDLKLAIARRELKTTESQSVALTTGPKLKKKAGRPKKKISVSSNNATPVNRRKRGRPRKQPEANARADSTLHREKERKERNVKSPLAINVPNKHRYALRSRPN